MPRSLLDALAVEAKRHNMTVADFVRTYLEGLVNKDKLAAKYYAAMEREILEKHSKA